MPAGAQTDRCARRILTAAQPLNLACFREERFRFAKQRETGARKHRLRSASSNEQTLAEMFLQRGDVRGDGCLGDTEAVRGPDEVAVLCRFDEDFELTQRARNHRSYAAAQRPLRPTAF